jgi:hypothetical protein
VPTQVRQQELEPNYTRPKLVKQPAVKLHAWLRSLTGKSFNTPSNLPESRTADFQGEGSVAGSKPVVLIFRPPNLRTKMSISSMVVELPELLFFLAWKGEAGASLSITYGYELILRVDNVIYAREVLSNQLSLPATQISVSNVRKPQAQSLQVQQQGQIPPNASIELEAQGFWEIASSSEPTAELSIESAQLTSPLGAQFKATMLYEQQGPSGQASKYQ